METTAIREASIDLRGRMMADHHRLETLFRELQCAFEEDVSTIELRRLWSALDEGLTAHMNAEEEIVLPELARIDPIEAKALQREHEELRRRLLELGVGVDLHVVREKAARAFLDTLREHADREDQLLYVWAASRITPAAQESLLSRLR
ncbi:MAG TPA: hemerythrin domain-containing protein [Kofleriaceae bacterium]|nr:hemerythrin domain-containing protein [Kofleriaceae bacterium]